MNPSFVLQLQPQKMEKSCVHFAPTLAFLKTEPDCKPSAFLVIDNTYYPLNPYFLNLLSSDSSSETNLDWICSTISTFSNEKIPNKNMSLQTLTDSTSLKAGHFIALRKKTKSTETWLYAFVLCYSETHGYIFVFKSDSQTHFVTFTGLQRHLCGKSKSIPSIFLIQKIDNFSLLN